VNDEGTLPFWATLIAVALVSYYYQYGAGSYTFTAEVSYYMGDQISYDYAFGLKSLDQCQSAAALLRGKDGRRAFGWSCLKTDSKGNYISRHR
jgi:hypothetical protein